MDGVVNPKVVDIITQAQAATILNPKILTASGNGKAYQSVAQSAAIAIQDATDALRNISTIATTASGVAIAQALAEKPNPEALQEIQKMMTTAIQDYSAIAKATVAMLESFPSH
jgi:hypothetical protein